jgi:hypothetical protein
MKVGMRTVSRLVLVAFFVLSGAACLPQAVPTGAPAGSPGSIVGGANPEQILSAGAAGATRESSGSVDGATDINAGDEAAPATPFEQYAEAPPSAGPANHDVMMFAEKGMQSGTAAPTHDPTGGPQMYLRGTRESECREAGGKTRVHVRGLVSVKTSYTRHEEVPFNGEGGGIRLHYRDADADGEETVDVQFQYPPHAPATPQYRYAIQVQNEPMNYVEVTVSTTQPDSLRYDFLWFDKSQTPAVAYIDPVMNAMFSFFADLSDVSPLRVPPCFEPKMGISNIK